MSSTSLAAIGVVVVVALHIVVTAFPFASAYGILRWRWFAWIHVPLFLWAFSIPFVSYPCPFTDWEKALRADAGLPVYQGHFLQHYVYEPLAPHGELFFLTAAALIVGPAYVLILRKWKWSERARRLTRRCGRGHDKRTVG